MPQNYCHHINAAGVFCGDPPMKKRDYCFWHLHEKGRRMKAARARARSERVLFKLPVLDDPYAVQVVLMQLAEAIAHREIDNSSGRLLLSALRLAATNLKTLRNWNEETQNSVVIEDPGFEEQYGLPNHFDLSIDPEAAFPPPEEPVTTGAPYIPGVGMCENGDISRARAGQILRDARTPIPGTAFQVTADDMELMDVYEREGEQARLQRAAVLERNRNRREARERRLYYEQAARNRNIQLAAQLMVAQQRKAEQTTDTQLPESAQSSRKPPKAEGMPPTKGKVPSAGGA